MTLEELTAAFQKLYKGQPRIYRAPGRVNLIGEHTDYNEGFVMPAAINFSTFVAITKRDDQVLKIHSDIFKEEAEIDLAQGDPVAAEGRITAALKLQSQWAPAFERMGTALVRQKRHAEAIGWFEKAIRERPEDTDALQGLGVALAECGRLEDAVCNWEAALSHGVHTADLHDNLANSLSLLGRRAEARAHRALSRRLQGKGRFGLDLVREAWEWLTGGTGPRR